jgi:hypothetical protein
MPVSYRPLQVGAVGVRPLHVRAGEVRLLQVRVQEVRPLQVCTPWRRNVCTFCIKANKVRRAV